MRVNFTPRYGVSACEIGDFVVGTQIDGAVGKVDNGVLVEENEWIPDLDTPSGANFPTS